MQNLITFVLAVADNWFFWIGIVLSVEPYIEAAWPEFYSAVEGYLGKHPRLRQKTFRALGLVALFLAFFHAWNVQYEAAGQNKDHLAMKELIHEAANDGEQLNTNWFSRNDEDKFKEETNDWTNKVGNLIEDAYGKGEASLLMSDAGYTSYTDGKTKTDVHNWIIHRLQRLNELLPRVDALSFQPDFDPTKYRWPTK